MVAEGILQNPCLFDPKLGSREGLPDLDQIALEYLTYAKKYVANMLEAKKHLYVWMNREIIVIHFF